MTKNVRPYRILVLAAGAAAMILTTTPVAQAAEPNFASNCLYSHSAPDDPIVFPGQPGASHLHDFFGNRSTDAHSTYESLRQSETTCQLEGDTGAYWSPALYDSGELVTPTNAFIYYRTGGKAQGSIHAFPADLKVVAKDQNVRTIYGCGEDTTVSGTKQYSVPTCPDGKHLVIRYRFPDCWDGKNLDSADHTSHMAFNRGGSCPSSHPRPVPMMTMNIHYPSDGGDIVLGSPDMPVPPHADFFNSWDQAELERLVTACLNSGRTCGTKPPSGSGGGGGGSRQRRGLFGLLPPW